MSLRKIDFQLPHELIQIDRDVIDGIFERNGKQIVIVVSYEKARKHKKGTMTFVPRKEE
jgi:hypothetical protein